MARSKWLTPQEQRAWRAFLVMQREFGGRIAQATQHDTGLSAADYEVLVNLSEAPGGRMRVPRPAARITPLSILVIWTRSSLLGHGGANSCEPGRRGSSALQLLFTFLWRANNQRG